MFDSIYPFKPLLNSEVAVLVKVQPKLCRDMRVKVSSIGLRVGNLWRFRASDLDRRLPCTVSSDRYPCRLTALEMERK